MGANTDTNFAFPAEAALFAASVEPATLQAIWAMTVAEF